MTRKLKWMIDGARKMHCAQDAQVRLNLRFRNCLEL